MAVPRSSDCWRPVQSESEVVWLHLIRLSLMLRNEVEVGVFLVDTLALSP